MPPAIRDHLYGVAGQKFTSLQPASDSIHESRAGIIDSMVDWLPFRNEKTSRVWEVFRGGRWGSNPQPPDPQSGALPLSYAHRNSAQILSRS